jgi:hypothetical protein
MEMEEQALTGVVEVFEMETHATRVSREVRRRVWTIMGLQPPEFIRVNNMAELHS